MKLAPRHHYPALDGLRGLAFLAVFVAHFCSMVASSAISWGGWLGVDLFFVLSGFLITGILFDSLHSKRYFRTFYIRRALRIFPLYYLPWVVLLVCTPWLHPLWTRFDVSRVFYYANLMGFVAARHPEIQAGGCMFYTPAGHFTGFNVGHLWSLCLEEQFYLIWPLLVFLLKDRRRIMTVCLAGIVLSVPVNTWLSLWATRSHAERTFLYDATYCHFAPMLFGAWLALWLRGREHGRPVSPAVYLPLIFVPAALLAASIFFIIGSFDQTHPIVVTYGYTLSGLMSTGLVLAAIQQGGWIKETLSSRWLISIGVISYGLYLIHGYLMGTFRHHLPRFQQHGVAWLMPVAAFAVTFGLAWVSYRFFELPFLRLKDRLAPSKPVDVTGRDDAAAYPRTKAAGAVL